jgi:hypothetical protein
MTAETIAKALGGHRAGATWMARCPVHDDRSPSLSISARKDGKVLVRCHAGCTQEEVIAALRSRGLWQDRRSTTSRFTPTNARRSNGEPDDRTEFALSIWHASRSPSGTLVETYLRSRGISVRQLHAVRFHPNLKHPSGSFWPAMVALVTSGVDDVPLAIHRTFLSRDGTCKAPIDPQKMMMGPCRGAVRLLPLGEVLMIGEGIETCLAAMQATGHPAWAALSTSGLRTLDLPTEVRDVIVLADGDDPGEAAANAAALRWKRDGRRVRIAKPPNGNDFNDVLLGRGTPFEGTRP